MKNPFSRHAGNKASHASSGLSLQTKMLALFLAVSLIPGLAVTLVSLNQTRSALTNAAEFSLHAGAAQIAAALDAAINSNLDSTRTEANQNIFVTYLKLPPSARSDSALKDDIRYELTTLSLKEPTYILSYALVDLNGRVLADTVNANVGKSEESNDYFGNVLDRQVPYVTPVVYNKNGILVLYFAAPVRDETGAIVGILRSEYRAAMLQELINRSIQDAGQDITVSVFDEYNIRIADSSEPELIQKTLAPMSQDLFETLVTEGRLRKGTPTEQATNNIDYNQALNDSDSIPFFIIDTARGRFAVAVAPVKSKPLKVAYSLPETLFLSDVQKRTTTTLITMLGLAVLVVVVAVFSTRQITNPIKELSNVAAIVTGGDLNVRAHISRKDEIGALAVAFNLMTGRLQETLAGLERRVAERTQALMTVSEISTAASTVLDTDKLLQQVIDLAKERFGFYHAHIYLLNEAGDRLVLSSGAGEVGRRMVAEGRSIPLASEQSLVARAAREKKGVTVNDVTTAPDFLPNPLLPDTHAEMAVPMMIGDQVIGVFDVQSEIIGRFTDADIAVSISLSSQVATALQNARSFSEGQRSQAQLSEALRISHLAYWEYDVERDRFIFNDQYYSIFHTTAEQMGGYELSSAEYAERLVYPDDLPMVGTEIEKALASTGKYYSVQLEHRILYGNGGVGHISVEVHIERDANGKIIHYYGVNQDITERKLLENQLAQRAQQQETINLVTQKIQNTITVEEALQVAAREIGWVVGMKPTLVMLEPDKLADDKSQDKY